MRSDSDDGGTYRVASQTARLQGLDDRMATHKTTTTVLSPQIAATLAVLKQTKYQASVDVLTQGLKTKNPAIRIACLQALLDRGTERDFAAILAQIDHSSQEELATIRPHVRRLTDAIDAGVVARDPEVRQRSLWAIARFELETHFRHLVAAVCNPDDPQQLVAMELVSHLARSMGSRARKGDRSLDVQRYALQVELISGIESYSQHRVGSLLDWWAAVAHWDDDHVLQIVRDTETSESLQRIAQHLERSKNKETLELVAGFLWSRISAPSLLNAAGKRTDSPFLEMLAKLYRSMGETRELKKNLVQPGIDWVFLEEATFHDERVSNEARMVLVEFMTMMSLPAEDILPRIAWLVQHIDASQEEALAEVLEHQRPLNADLAIIALSDALDAPDIESSEPPPWKQSMRNALDIMLSLYSTRSARIQEAISVYFREFKCETLLEKLLDWPAGHLSAYARLTRIANPDFVDELLNELNAQAPQRRQRGVQAARLFGMDEVLEALIINRLEDTSDDVRVEAIIAMADSCDPQNAIDLIRPLAAESNPTIQQAAYSTLQCLGGAR